MKLYKILLLACLSFFCLSNFSYCKNNETKEIKGGINQNQPISVGENIYFKIFSTSKIKGYVLVSSIISVKYNYSGVEGNTLKVEYTSYYNLMGDEEEKTTVLNLPLNQDKQTLLKVRTLEKPKEKELIITVVDDFFRITAKELQ